jgi:GT2 family glycosyltransferase
VSTAEASDAAGPAPIARAVVGPRSSAELAADLRASLIDLCQRGDAFSIQEAIDVFQRFEEATRAAARQLDAGADSFTRVTEADRFEAALALEAGCSAWRGGEAEAAVAALMQAVACDPFDDLARALLGGLMHGLPWPQERPRRAGHAPAVSIVIPVFNKLELTRQCLRGIALTAGGIAHEVIVVDNASTDGTAEFLRAEEEAGRLRAIVNEENLGFGAACNLGAERAYGEHVLFLNNDTIPLPGWLDALLHAMESDPDVGAAGARLLYPNWTIQHAGIVFNEQSAPYHAHRGAAMNDAVVLEARDFPAVTGACLLVRSELLLQLGGFSPAYRMYVEDVDLCFAVWAAGYRVRYCPDCVLVHLENASVTSTAWRDEMVREGWATLHSRWAGRLPARVAVLCGPAFAPVRLRRRMQGARSFVGLAFAEELVERPTLLESYARTFDDSDDATLVISSPGSVERLAALVDSLGLDTEDSADLLAVGAETSHEELAIAVDFVLSRRPLPGPLGGLPCYDERTVEQLRMHASARGLAA